MIDQRELTYVTSVVNQEYHRFESLRQEAMKSAREILGKFRGFPWSLAKSYPREQVNLSIWNLESKLGDTGEFPRRIELRIN